MTQSLIVENRTLRQRVSKLEKEVQALREQCSQSCHDDLIEQVRLKYQVPRWMLSKTSYEILATKDFRGVEKFMQDRARLLVDSPKLVSKEV